MAILYCNNCGTAMDEGAKFCRVCGQPSNSFEATTRTLDPPQYQSPTSPTNTGQTTPSYVQPNQYYMAPATQTNSLESGGNRKAIIALVVIVSVLFISVVVLGTIMMIRSDPPPPRGAVIVGSERQEPAAPSAPGTLPPPPVPSIPPPPPPPATGGDILVDRALVYPNAQVRMNMAAGEEGAVLQLSTNDPIERVIAWYVEKLKPTKRVNIPGGNTLLQAGRTAVVITGLGGEINVIIKQGIEP